MPKNIKYFINTIINLKKEGLFTAPNLLRLLGMASRHKAFVGPLKIDIDITNRCDMQCIMCWYHSPAIKQISDAPKELPLSVFVALSKELKNLGVKCILLGGEGEPFMHPEISEMIEVARKNSLEVEIMTNAYHLDKEKINFLIKARVKKILVSLHCADKETFLRVRPLKNKNDFDRILKNLFLLRDLHHDKHLPSLFIINCLSGLNFDNVREMAGLAEQLQADKILFRPLSLTKDLPTSLIITEQKREQIIKHLKEIASGVKIPNNIEDYARFLKEEKIKNQENILKICYMPWVHSAIGLDGRVLGCVYSNSPKLGNIYQSLFTDIWYGEKYNVFRKGQFCPRRCRGKSVYPLLF